MSEELFRGRPLRWTPKRKVRAVLLVNDGQIARSVALKLWGISEEEWMSWQRLYSRHGAKGLRATSVQKYRRAGPAAALAAVLFAHAANAQMQSQGGSIDMSQPRGFSITTPGGFPTRAYPRADGGYTLVNPDRPMSFITPNGNGYTVVTPGGGPLRFIRPND